VWGTLFPLEFFCKALLSARSNFGNSGSV
jgi:hypothetical protein